MAPNRATAGCSLKRDGTDEDDDNFHECQSPVDGDSNYKKQVNEADASNHQDKDEDTYGVYDGTTDYDDLTVKVKNVSSMPRRLTRHVSRELSRRGSDLLDTLQETPPVGWAILCSATCSAMLGYEVQFQKQLTSPPIVFGQCRHDSGGAPLLEAIYRRLTQHKDSLFTRSIQPSLFVGTRGVLASAAAFAMPFSAKNTKDHLRFREIITTSQDGAKIAIDWEVPPDLYESSVSLRKTAKERKERILQGGPIELPVVLILHGINNDTSFGYMRSLMWTVTNRGWIAVGMNFRGCGGIAMSTPRGYTGAYTGDLRHVVRTLSTRLAPTTPLFLVGNSLGANLVTKYLGEEGRSGTLPSCVAGGVSLGNPMHLSGSHMSFPFAHLLSLGVRKGVLEHWRTLRNMSKTSPQFRQCIHNALCANTIGKFDEAMSPIFIRNDPSYPFQTRIGYKNGNEYWDDGSSYKVVQHVSVPLMKLTSQDDFLVYGTSSRKMSYCLENPNVMFVKTKCGGHLGWQECPPDTGNMFGFGTSWANTATADFIEAILRTRSESSSSQPDEAMPTNLTSSLNEKGEYVDSGARKDAFVAASKLRSRL